MKTLQVGLKDYLQQGGKVLSFAIEIPYLDGAESTALNELKISFSGQWTVAKETDEPAVKQLFSINDFSLEETIPVSGELYHQRRIMDDGQLLFVVNTDTTNSTNVIVNAKGKQLIKMDLQTGECSQLPAIEDKGQLSFEIKLPPVGSALYFTIVRSKSKYI